MWLAHLAWAFIMLVKYFRTRAKAWQLCRKAGLCSTAKVPTAREPRRANCFAKRALCICNVCSGFDGLAPRCQSQHCQQCLVTAVAALEGMEHNARVTVVWMRVSILGGPSPACVCLWLCVFVCGGRCLAHSCANHVERTTYPRYQRSRRKVWQAEQLSGAIPCLNRGIARLSSLPTAVFACLQPRQVQGLSALLCQQTTLRRCGTHSR